MRISDWSSDVCSSDLRDLVLPAVALRRICDLYAGDWDRADPELSPLYMDCDGMPPMLFVTTDNEMLLDDTLMLVERLHEAGIDTPCHVWPLLPHAFPVFDRYFRECRLVRAHIVAFPSPRLIRPAGAR